MQQFEIALVYFNGCNGLVSDFKLPHCIFNAKRKVSMSKLRHSTGEIECDVMMLVCGECGP